MPPSKPITSTKLGGSNIIKNLGIMFVIALAIAIFLFFLLLLKKLTQRYESVRKVYKKIADKVFYRLFIRYVMQSTLKVQIAAASTIVFSSWSTFSGVAEYMVGFILFLAFLMSPFIFALVLWANYENLDAPSIRRKIGTLYDGVYLENDHIYGLSYSFVFLTRRSLFVWISFLLYDHPPLQLQAFFFSSILYMCYLCSNRIYIEPFTY